jgi:hypothetical protein
MNVYGHNIYIDDSLVGYISGGEDGNGILFVSGRVFAHMNPEGAIIINDVKVGHIDDGGDVYLHNKLVGEVDATNDIRFYGDKLKA